MYTHGSEGEGAKKAQTSCEALQAHADATTPSTCTTQHGLERIPTDVLKAEFRYDASSGKLLLSCSSTSSPKVLTVTPTRTVYCTCTQTETAPAGIAVSARWKRHAYTCTTHRSRN